MTGRLHIGDNAELLAGLEDCSVDACVTDPPYELSNDGKASAVRVALEMVFPQQTHIKAEASGGCMLQRLASEILSLDVVGFAPRPALAMKPRAVTLHDHASAGDHDIEHGGEGAVGIAQAARGVDGEAERTKYLGCFALELADRSAALELLDRSGTCFASGGVRVGFRIPPSSLPSLLDASGVVGWIQDDIGPFADALTSLVGTLARAEVVAMPWTLQVAEPPIDRLPAITALHFLAVAKYVGAKLVRATPRARRLSSVLQSRRVRVVSRAADRAVSFDLLTHRVSVASTGFMGKGWDGSKVAYDVERWRQVLRVLKPGGHLLAFGGTRTYHRMACAIEDAGFEIRDSIHWHYGSGFPKNHDVSKAIDKSQRGDLIAAKIAHFMQARGVTASELTHTAGLASAASITDWTEGGHCPSDRNWKKIAKALDVTAEEESRFERIILKERRSSDRRGDGSTYGLNHSGICDLTAGATDAARQWEGWGSALKPSHEPLIIAQKKFDAVPQAWENVLRATPYVEALLWSMSPASLVERAFKRSRAASNGQPFGSVRWIAAVVDMLSCVDQSARTAMFRSPEVASTYWSIVTSWRRISDAALDAPSTSTTETAIVLTTALRTSRSLISAIIPACTTEAAIQTRGLWWSADSAESSSSAKSAKSNSTRRRSADALAISPTVSAIRSMLADTAASLSMRHRATEESIAATSAQPASMRPSDDDGSTSYVDTAESRSRRSLAETRCIAGEGAWPQRSDANHAAIVVARKPLDGTIAANVLEWGTGALNIAGTRIDPGSTVPGGGNGKAHNGGRYGAGQTDGVRARVIPHNAGTLAQQHPPNPRRPLHRKRLRRGVPLCGVGSAEWAVWRRIAQNRISTQAAKRSASVW